ncbi:hypothetical protein GALMADRAFT_244901 [Galerina marginata CBS 339.88]|uniref:Heme peroxidase n=1 Tax=Galerina marginata (strain CBS 339.88) TaxID=685588 RepID=A0A067TDJ4_GALM3|nr:hypothetical protein GALMADRAFT_244901 [Galerina marginata CBS 339.88]
MASISAVQAVTLAADAIHLASRPPPTAPTGYYDWQVSSDPDASRQGHAAISNLISDAETLKAKGAFAPDPEELTAFQDIIAHPHSVDDRKGAFGDGLGILARLDPYTDLAKELNNTVMGVMYGTNPHPPASYIGPANSFRQADGGGNSLQDYNMGRAGTPYARSVQGKAGLPRTSLPDPGLIFDTLLKRNGQENHPAGVSSLIFAFAAIVTHSLFRTDQNNIHINNASSYLDLSPLYGDNQAAQDKVRDKAAGRGLLYPDTFSEERLTFLVPATSALLVIFSRNHNYVAEKILKINERKRWSDPPPSDPAKLAAQDEEIFQTAKLINCGHFISAILGDYVAGFLGNGEGCNWNMSPFDLIDEEVLKVDRGRGNHVSVEFSILYRWHATVAQDDEQWINDTFNQVFNGKPFDQLSVADLPVIAEVFTDVPPNPAQRTFGGLQRGPDGKFSDDDLAKVLQQATVRPASAYRARGTPAALRLVEILGIQQAREWGLCTMNEFRAFLGLKKFESFTDWNPDPKIAKAAERLYGHIDNLELYTGLQAESVMPQQVGSHFGFGYTVTRAVLGDAISLIRGDRFYTSDFTPANLTNWGYYDCQRDMNNGAGGSQIPKLLMRALPRHYSWNSVYSLYPFFTPSKMKDSLTRQGLQDKYTFDPPTTIPVAKVFNTFTGIKTIFNDSTKFKVIYEKFGYGSILMFDDISQHTTDRAMIMHAVFPDTSSIADYAAFFAATVKKKISETVWSYDNVPGNYIDIVKGVIYPTVAHIAAEKFTGVPLKTKDNPRGLYTELEMFDMLATLFMMTFLAFDAPEINFALHASALQAGTVLGALATKSLLEATPPSHSSFSGLLAEAASFVHPVSDKPWYGFFNRLAATGRAQDQIIGNVLGIAVGASVNHAHATVNAIDFYLDDERKSERDNIVQLVQHNSSANDALLLGYVNEAMRLRPQFEGLWREATVDATVDQGPGLPAMQVKKGDRLRASFRNAHLNSLDFPNPTAVDPRRPPLPFDNINGTGFHGCPGVNYAQKAMVEVFKVVFSLKNLRRASGDAGTLRRFNEIVHETESDVFVQRNGTTSPWPGSMYLVFDA